MRVESGFWKTICISRIRFVSRSETGWVTSIPRNSTRALGNFFQADNALDQSGFAAAGLTHHTQCAAFGKAYADIIDRLDEFFLAQTKEADNRIGFLGIIHLEVIEMQQFFIGGVLGLVLCDLCGWAFTAGLLAIFELEGIICSGPDGRFRLRSAPAGPGGIYRWHNHSAAQRCIRPGGDRPAVGPARGSGAGRHRSWFAPDVAPMPIAPWCRGVTGS